MEASRTRLRLRVAPGSRRTEVVGRHGDAWKVSVSAPPDRGRANDAVVSLLAATLGLDRPDVRLVAGASARDKVVELTGLTVDEAERRLDEAGRKERP